MSIRIVLLMFLGASLAPSALAQSPAEEARRVLASFAHEPSVLDVQKAAASYAEVLQKYEVVKGTAAAARVERVGRRIARATGKDWDWEFHLLDAEPVNAFCLPGGKIAVFTGILEYVETLPSEPTGGAARGPGHIGASGRDAPRSGTSPATWSEPTMPKTALMTIEARAAELAASPADFTLANPNRLRSLVGAFCMSNQLHFHAADGSGYRFAGDVILEVDGLNRQTAARLARLERRRCVR